VIERLILRLFDRLADDLDPLHGLSFGQDQQIL